MPDKNLPEQIANQLRRDILRGGILPGAAIKERDHAAKMGVSRTPMREAIRLLATEGLVTLRPSRSPVVAQPSLREVADTIDVLNALEMLAARQASQRATVADLNEVCRLDDEIRNGFACLDDVDRFELDMAFHAAIVSASHNPLLIDTHSAVLARLWRVRFLAPQKAVARRAVLDQHAAIVSALIARDGEATHHALHAHLDPLLDYAREFF